MYIISPIHLQDVQLILLELYFILFSIIAHYSCKFNIYDIYHFVYCCLIDFIFRRAIH